MRARQLAAVTRRKQTKVAEKSIFSTPPSLLQCRSVKVVCVYEKYFWHNFFSLKVAEKPIFARLKWQLNAALVSFGVGGL